MHDYPPRDIRIERPAADTAVAVFLGEHDIASRSELRTLLESLVEENAVVVADFTDATFVDSTTIHVLLTAHAAARVRGKTFRLQLGTAAIVRTAFELTGVLNQIECASSREEALFREQLPRS